MKPVLYTTGTTLSWKSWLAGVRLPFYSVGVTPFLLGAILARFHGYTVELPVLFLAVTAVILIMLSTYLLGEYYDFESDRINKEFNRFSGGSRVFIRGDSPPKALLVISYLAIFLAAVIGLVLNYYYQTGFYTLPLGITGLLLGIFYSSKPLQLAYRGLGEAAIGFCYGWLTINSGYYIISATFHPAATLISLPVGCSIVAVILINEFPDRQADKKAGKKNLVVRIGRSKAAAIYVILTALTLVFLLTNLSLKEISTQSTWFFILPLGVGMVNIIAIIKKRYLDRFHLEKICGTTIIFNLLVSCSYLLSLLVSISKTF